MKVLDSGNSSENLPCYYGGRGSLMAIILGVLNSFNDAGFLDVKDENHISIL